MSPDGPSSGAWRMIEASSGFQPHAITGSIVAVERARRGSAGEHAGLVHVDVRIGLVAGDHGGVVDQLARQVGVIVERDRDRQRRARCGAGAARSRLRRRRSPRSPSRRAGRGTRRRSPRAPRPRAGARSVSNVARDALFDGHDSAATGVTTSAPSRCAMSRYAASGVLVPLEARARRRRRTRALRRGRTTTSGVGDRRERVGLVLDQREDEAAHGHRAQSRAANAGPSGFRRRPGRSRVHANIVGSA